MVIDTAVYANFLFVYLILKKESVEFDFTAPRLNTIITVKI